MLLTHARTVHCYGIAPLLSESAMNLASLMLLLFTARNRSTNQLPVPVRRAAEAFGEERQKGADFW